MSVKRTDHQRVQECTEGLKFGRQSSNRLKRYLVPSADDCHQPPHKLQRGFLSPPKKEPNPVHEIPRQADAEAAEQQWILSHALKNILARDEQHLIDSTLPNPAGLELVIYQPPLIDTSSLPNDEEEFSLDESYEMDIS